MTQVGASLIAFLDFSGELHPTMCVDEAPGSHKPSIDTTALWEQM